MLCILHQQLLDMDEAGEEDGANVDLDSQRKGKCAVIKTSTRQVSLSFFCMACSHADFLHYCFIQTVHW